MNKFVMKKYKNKVIILDNASSHRNKKVKDLIQEKTNYCIQYHTNIIKMLLKIYLVF